MWWYPYISYGFPNSFAENEIRGGTPVETTAVVFDQPERLSLRSFVLPDPTPADIIVGVQWSGVSTGTERLLWSGRMPWFPGLGYPLVPGYEAVGRVLEAGPESGRIPGQLVFVPGAKCYGETRGLFGTTGNRSMGSANRSGSMSDYSKSNGYANR